MKTLVTTIEYDCGCTVEFDEAHEINATIYPSEREREEAIPRFCDDHPDAPAVAIDKDVRLDYSGLSPIWLCDRLYEYTQEERLRTLAPANALRFGTWIHAGMEIFWKAVKEGHDIETASEIAAQQFQDLWTDNGGLLDDVRTDETAYAIFPKYPIFLQNQMLAGEAWRPKEMEISGAVSLGTIKVGLETHNIYYVVNIDLTCDKGEGTPLWLFDFKTHKNSGFYPQWIRPWDVSHQMTGYLYCYRELTHNDCAGINIIGILVKRLKSGPAPDFITIPQTRTEGQLEEWRRDILASYQRIVINRRANHWMKCDSACSKWGICDFMPVCGSDPRERQGVINLNYQKVFWDAEKRQEIQIEAPALAADSGEFRVDFMRYL
jgi:hypothetical protein